MLREATQQAADDYHLWARGEQLTVQAMRSSRTWRLRERLLRFAPLRAALARKPDAS